MPPDRATLVNLIADALATAVDAERLPLTMRYAAAQAVANAIDPLDEHLTQAHGEIAYLRAALAQISQLITAAYLAAGDAGSPLHDLADYVEHLHRARTRINGTEFADE